MAKTHRVSRFLQWVSAILSGIVGMFISDSLIFPWINLGLRRPIQEWMIAHGLGAYVGQVGVLSLEVPDMLLGICIGAILGRVFFLRWLGVSLVFGGTLLLMPRMWGPGPFYIHPSALYIESIMYGMIILPGTIAAAWLASRKPMLTRMRQARNKCVNCGYYLTGNTSGVCPECGTEVASS